VAGEEHSEVAGALDAVRALYTGNLAEFGIDSRSVGWPDPQHQQLRFDKLVHLIEADPGAEPFTVNDWGCGYAAMFHYLAERFETRLHGYRGYDISPEMVAAARRHVTDARAEFVESSDVDRDADYSFVSGTFNVRRGASEETWRAYVQDVLRQLAQRSRRGFAFNLLTTYVDWRSDDLFYADPADFFTFCRSELSSRVTLFHDYPLYEWTMIVHKH
jgi:hypothetical protein